MKAETNAKALGLLSPCARPHDPAVQGVPRFPAAAQYAFLPRQCADWLSLEWLPHLSYPYGKTNLSSPDAARPARSSQPSRPAQSKNSPTAMPSRNRILGLYTVPAGGDVRSGAGTDILATSTDVRFTPEGGH